MPRKYKEGSSASRKSKISKEHFLRIFDLKYLQIIGVIITAIALFSMWYFWITPINPDDLIEDGDNYLESGDFKKSTKLKSEGDVRIVKFMNILH